MDRPGDFSATEHPVICMRCGYELRGLLPSSVCPECAYPIIDSLQRRRLGLSSSSYLALLRSGSLLSALALVIFIIAGLAGWPVLANLFSFGSQASFRLFDLAGAAVLLAGIWMLTIDDPGLHPCDQARPNKRAMRGASIGLVVFNIFVALLWMRIPIAPPRAAGAMPLLHILLPVGSALIQLALWLTLATGLVNYARWLAVRVPDERLFRMAATLNWLLPCALIGAFIVMPAFGNAGRIVPLGFMVALLLATRERLDPKRMTVADT